MPCIVVGAFTPTERQIGGTEILCGYGNGIEELIVQFVYRKDKNAYIVPITGINAVYSPVITDIKEKGSSAILTVGYLAGEDWELDENGDMVPPEPVKYMKVYLRKNSDGYYISSIKQADKLDSVSKEETESETANEKGDK